MIRRHYVSAATVHNLGHAAMAAGDIQRATRLFLESADRYGASGRDRRGLAECVVGLACTAVRAGQILLAARLFGSAEAALERLQTVLSPPSQADYERGLGALAASGSADSIAAERALGQTLELEQAVDEARALVLGLHAVGATSTQLNSLTSREREVAALLARGMRNREIAEVLVIAERTAKNHVQRVLDKLGVHSRAEVAARAEELGLARGQVMTAGDSTSG